LADLDNKFFSWVPFIVCKHISFLAYCTIRKIINFFWLINRQLNVIKIRICNLNTLVAFINLAERALFNFRIP